MFRALCAHHRRSKLYYTASCTITPVGGRPMNRTATYPSLKGLLEPGYVGTTILQKVGNHSPFDTV